MSVLNNFIIASNLIDRCIDGKILIINLKTGNATLISEIGVVFWESIKNGTSKNSLIKTILNEYDVDILTLEKDYDEFIKKLLSLGILVEKK